jgi:hypothetical protein
MNDGVSLSKENDGIVIVHAHYNPLIINKSPFLKNSPTEPVGSLVDKLEEITITNDNVDRERGFKGLGYIRKIDGKYFIITCNHVMKPRSKYVAYQGTGKNTIMMNLVPHIRLFELDIIVLSVVDYKKIEPESESTQNVNNLVDVDLKELISSENIKRIYNKSGSDKSNSNGETQNWLITGEYKAGDGVMLKHIPINTDIICIDETIFCKGFADIPILSFRLEENDKLFTALKNDFVVSTNEQLLKGLSGSIICNGNESISMIMMYMQNINTNEIYIKSIPLRLLDIIVECVIIRNFKSLIGIKLSKCVCDFDGKEYNARYITRTSCRLINGRSTFQFNEGDLIVQVDGNNFTENSLLQMDMLGCAVTINAYLFIKCMLDQEVDCTVIRSDANETKMRTYSLSGIEYNDMFRCRTYHLGIFEWNQMIFMEMSQQVIDYYESQGRPLTGWKNKIDEYSLTDERYVILYNYRKKVNLEKITQKQYDTMPCLIDNNYFFYIVEKIGNRKITNIKDLIEMLSGLPSGKTSTMSMVDICNNRVKIACNSI